MLNTIYMLSSPILVIGVLVCWLHVQEEQNPSNSNPKLPSGWHVHDMERPQPKVVAPAEKNWDAPVDAIVLFDGTDLSQWKGSIVDRPKAKNPDGKPRWKIEDDYMEVTPTGGISTKQKFGDMQLHIEWASPNKVVETAQRRGNSGVFLMGRYEIQIMDGFENTAYADGSAAAVYGQSPPLVNVCRKPGQWQSYDIIFTAPRFKDEKLESPGKVTVFHNGVLVQHETEILGPTRPKKTSPYVAHGEKAPISLQNHGQPVRFRNIWVRDLSISE